MPVVPAVRALAILALVFTLPAPSSAEAVPSCIVTFHLVGAHRLGSLQFTADYSRVQGSFRGRTTTVDCKPLIDRVALQTVDVCDGSYAECQWGEDRLLSVILSRNDAFTGPADIVECEFEAVDKPAPVTFDVAVLAATGATPYDIVTPLPEVTVGSVHCVPSK